MAITIDITLIRNGGSTHTPGLEKHLAALGCTVRVFESCRDLAAQLSGASPPHLIMTDLFLPDGTWEHILQIARSAPLPVNVIVASRLADIPLYIETLEKGAFDFITPPFELSDLSHVVRCAFGNVTQKREGLSRASRLCDPAKIRPDLAVAT